MRHGFFFGIVIAVLSIGVICFSSSGSVSEESVTEGGGIATQSAIVVAPKKVDLFCRGVEEGDFADEISLDFGKILVTASDNYSLDIDNRILTIDSDSSDYSYRFARVYQDSADLETLAIFGMPDYSLKRKKERVLENGVALDFGVVGSNGEFRLVKYSLATENAYGNFVYYVLEQNVEQRDLECIVCVESEVVVN